MRKTVIFGGNGMLGRALQPYWQNEDLKIVSRTSLIQIDVRDLKVLRRFLDDEKPDLIINCVANINFNSCEEEPEDAMRTNALPCGVMAEYSQERGAKLVYISSDCTREVVNMYGKSKLEGENLARKDSRSLIIRTNIIGDASFGKWAYETIQNDRECVLFEDYITSGIDVWSFGRILKDMIGDEMKNGIKEEYQGIWNIGSHGSASKMRYMQEMARIMKKKLARARIGSVTSLKPTRNLDTTLDVSKTEEALGYEFPGMREVCELLVKKLNQ